MKVINKGTFNIVKVNEKDHFSENSSIQILGNNNDVFIESKCSFKNLKIVLRGDNNKLHIKRGSWFLGGSISLASFSTLVVGERVSFGNRLEIVVESSKVALGNDCKIDAGLLLRTTDIHGIYSLSDGKVKNRPKGISIGDYVWIRRDVTVLKGANISSCNIVEMKSIFDARSALFEFWGGQPAKCLDKNVIWSKSAYLKNIEDDKYVQMYIKKYS